jgi:acyl-CoA dehydrogenase
MGQFESLCANEPELAELRTSIRAFLENDRIKYGWHPTVDAWLSGWDAEFSARLGAAGYLGLTMPTSYGGGGKTHMHRYVVTEELLAHGAPVAAHWMADRQVAPGVLAYGSHEQRRRLLPEITAGRLFFAIGLSEHEAGSDLAAATTRASRVDDGWLLNGTKVWTSGAHLADYVVVLVRTAALDPQRRHAGFSQFLVPRDAPGVHVSPIVTMSGEHHFNEVVFDDVLVPDDDVLGHVGDGWRQVTAELAYERSGPERILTTTPLMFSAIRAASGAPSDATARQIGELLARMTSLRQLSISVARTLTSGGSATVGAALVKDLGTRFEQESVSELAGLLEDTTLSDETSDQLATAYLHRPMFTLRGGTNEVLRGLVARGLGVR